MDTGATDFDSSNFLAVTARYLGLSERTATVDPGTEADSLPGGSLQPGLAVYSSGPRAAALFLELRTG